MASDGDDLVRVLAPLLTAALVSLIAAKLLLRARSKGGNTRTRSNRRSWVSDTDLDVSPLQFWSASLGAGLVTWALVAAVTSLPVVALMPGVVVATLPRVYFGRRRALQTLETQLAWPDALRDLVSAVRSGASLPTAVEELALFGPAPIRRVLTGFASYASSLGFVEALEMVKAELGDPTSDRVVEVLILAYERGGNVVPQILNDLADATTKDAWTLEQIRTEALEQKINARVVFVLPWVVLVLMTARSGPFREFYSSSAGILVVLLGGILSLVGMFIAARLGRTQSEPRVMVASGRER